MGKYSTYYQPEIQDRLRKLCNRLDLFSIPVSERVMGYQLIETITLASSASSIEFTSIPQDGVDLVILLSDSMNNR